MDVRAPDEGQYRFGPFLLDPGERSLTRDGAPVALTHRVFETLMVFVRHPGEIVSKDELMEAIWPGRYMEEGSLKQAIFTLRKVLGGDTDDTQYIVTAPGRGYSFKAAVERIAPIAKPQASGQSDSIAEPSAAANVAPIERPWPAIQKFAWSSAAALLLVGIAAVVWQRNIPSAPAQPKTLVLADFQNLSNDPALGAVLGRVLEIDLAQSPILILMPPQQVSETLKLMERPQDAKLTPALAQEVCARNNSDAALDGTVARIGSRFLVTLEARDCNAGTDIAEARADTGRMEDVPNLLDGLVLHLREGLNDSSASIPKFDVPIAQATTPSFEALKAYSLGENLRIHGDNARAIIFFKHAIELDSSFSLAYAELANCYLGLREMETAKAVYRKAFALRGRTSENERLGITANYYAREGNYVEAERAFRLWAQTYPQFWAPWLNLANLLTNMARYDDAIVAARQALRLNPRHYGPYVVLARAYKRATRFADAKAIGALAMRKGFENWDLHGLLYEIAYAEGDTRTMAAEVAKENGQTTEAYMLDYEALAAAASGQFRRSEALFGQAIALARSQGPDSLEDVGNFYSDQIETAEILASQHEAARIAATASTGEKAQFEDFAFASFGDYGRAASSAQAAAARHPDSTEDRDIELPLTLAEIDLDQKRPADAIAALQPILPYELRDFWAPWLLGRAWLGTGAPDRGAAEFRKILANRGVDGTSPLYPIAWLWLARALYSEGRLAESRASYERLFAFWKNADDDLPALIDARREYARIPAARQTALRDSK